MNEADTCRKFVVPLLQQAGLDNAPLRAHWADATERHLRTAFNQL